MGDNLAIYSNFHGETDFPKHGILGYFGVLYVRTNYGKAISTYIDNIDNLPPRGTVQQGRSSPPINDAHWKAKMMQNKPKDSTGSWLSAR